MIAESISLEESIKTIFDEELQLDGRSKLWRSQTKLYNNLPELDCITVVNILVAIEEKLNITIDYENYNAQIFATVNSLSAHIENKLLKTSHA